MGEKKVSIMVMKVDLQCSKCYKKVKKVLCKFPQIQDQVFDEKTNTVRIKVVCCSPEKIRDNLCCKGKGSITSIKILEPEKPKPNPVTKPEKPNEPNPATAPVAPDPHPVPGYPPVPNFGLCCRECCEGHGGGPCYQLGYRQVRYYDWYYERLVHDSCGGGCNNRVCRSRCTDYICEENPAAPCSIM